MPDNDGQLLDLVQSLHSKMDIGFTGVNEKVERVSKDTNAALSRLDVIDVKMEQPSPDIEAAKREMEYHLRSHPEHLKVQSHLDDAKEDNKDKREIAKGIVEWSIRGAILALLVKFGLMN